jgi:hypothetical protein
MLCEPDVDSIEKAVLTVIGKKDMLKEKGKHARIHSKNLTGIC